MNHYYRKFDNLLMFQPYRSDRLEGGSPQNGGAEIVGLAPALADGNGNGNGNGGGNKFQSLAVAVSVIGLGATITGALIAFFINTNSLNGSVSSMDAHIKSLESNYNLMAEREIILRTKVGELQSALSEVETRFCGEDQVRNMMQAGNDKLFSMLWKKQYPETAFPSSSYYPQLCKQQQHGSSPWDLFPRDGHAG